VKAASAQQERTRREAVKLRYQFAQGRRGIFSGVLPASKVRDVISEACEAWRDRVYSPATTLRLFIGQVLGEDRACQDVLSQLTGLSDAELKAMFAETGIADPADPTPIGCATSVLPKAHAGVWLPFFESYFFPSLPSLAATALARSRFRTARQTHIRTMSYCSCE
jgi:hypothetical protein